MTRIKFPPHWKDMTEQSLGTTIGFVGAESARRQMHNKGDKPMMTDADKAFWYYMQANSRTDEEEDDDRDDYDRVRAEVRAETIKEFLRLFEELKGPNADPAWIRKGAAGYDSMHSEPPKAADLDEPE
jgi:hypothetical protein